jgi:hypothetical protein
MGDVTQNEEETGEDGACVGQQRGEARGWRVERGRGGEKGVRDGWFEGGWKEEHTHNVDQ